MDRWRSLLYLSREDVVAAGLTMGEIIEAVTWVFLAKGEGRAQAPPKGAVYPYEDGFINSMPALVPGAVGVKWVSAYPSNARLGLPNIHALLVLNDPVTGAPLAVMDATWITAMRTGAVTGLSARLLASPGASTVAVLGCGVQGRTNLEALALVLPVTQVLAYDIDPAAQAGYVCQMRASYPGLEVVGVGEPYAAVSQAGVVVTAGPILKHPSPPIQREWLGPGGLGTPVDYDSYWTPEAVNACDRFFVDDLGQFAFLRTHGYFRHLREPDGDLGQVVAGQVEGRREPGERIIIMNLGLAITDVVTARAVYQRALEKGLGTVLPL
ncbi:MAG: ornithine cyclodeaminase family protein [Bacillota bacterium]